VRRPNLLLAAVAHLTAVAGAVLLPGLAGAQPVTCPAPGEDAASVVIDSPEAGTEVAGRVEVKGQAEGPATLFQVELFVGESRKDFLVLDPPVAATDFTLVWDAAAARPGSSTIHVVTCGGTTEFGRLIRGSASIDVQVPAPSAPPPTRALVAVESDDDRPGPSLVAGAVIAVPAVACLVYAMGRRRSN